MDLEEDKRAQGTITPNLGRPFIYHVTKIVTIIDV